MPLDVVTRNVRPAHKSLHVIHRARRPQDRRSGWLTAMVTHAQAQLHEGTAPVLPVPPVTRHRPVVVLGEPPQPPRMTAPQFSHIVPEDLTDMGRLLELYSQAVQLRVIPGSEAARLTFVGVAQHVLAARPTNPGGLFRHLLYRKRYQCVTHADEAAALQRLKQYVYGDICGRR